MDKRALKIGDWVQDARNRDYPIKVGVAELRYTELFEPIKITEDVLVKNGFRAEEFNGEKNYFRSEGTQTAVAHRTGEVWDVDIRNGNTHRYIGKITAVHELRNALSDCFIYWKFECE